MSRSIQLLSRAVLAALVAIAAVPASAAETKTPEQAAVAGAPGSPDPANCEDDAPKAADQKKREAALAELSRRLAAEKAEEGGMNLNRTGANYGPLRPGEDTPPPPPGKAAPPAPKPDAKAAKPH
jgi:hypothetical protein